MSFEVALIMCVLMAIPYFLVCRVLWHLGTYLKLMPYKKKLELEATIHKDQSPDRS